MKTARYMLLICLALFQVSIYAQKLHVIVFCDTNDKIIGVNKEAERKMTVNEMEIISGILEEYGYYSEITQCYGTYCSKNTLMQVINDLSVQSDDVVFFYYGGHGSHAYNNSNDIWPQMCLGERNENNWVPAELLKNMILKKGPRLAVIITACCNKEQDGVTIKSTVVESESYTTENKINKEAYKKLFLDFSGLVMMTSSQLGQYSFSNEQGGFFCRAFWGAMEYMGEGQISPDWNELCETVKKVVSNLDINYDGRIVHQIPDYRVVPSDKLANQSIGKKQNTQQIQKVNNVVTSLSNDLNKLLDKSISTDSRLQMIDGLLSTHFASGAKVRTLGRDMETVVDYEDAELFLRRITMSPFIKQINVVEENGGKNHIITVHELRTK